VDCYDNNDIFIAAFDGKNIITHPEESKCNNYLTEKAKKIEDEKAQQLLLD
jgi:hypothetical protein